MLPRGRRLTRHLAKDAGASRVLARTPHLLLKAVPSPHTRLSVVVPKRITPLAVNRNRIKRQIASLVAPLLPTLLPRAYFLLVVALPKKHVFEAFQTDVPALFRGHIRNG